MTAIQNAVQKLKLQQRLSAAEASSAANDLLIGECSESDIVTLLTLLSSGIGETTEEIIGFINAMRQHMVPLTFNETPLIDLCGTGGSLPNRFNVSTCVALVLGKLNYSIAKHGNRGSKRPNGSFDFLDALNIPFDLSETEHQSRLDDWGCTFIFARNHHPAVRHVAAARQQLAGASIFNYIGPFCNPASPSVQLIGAASHELADRLFDVGQQLNYDAFGIISSDIGLDECSTVGSSRLKVSRHGTISETIIQPTDFGIHHTIADISVSESALAIDNANLFKSLIKNHDSTHPLIDLVCLNAGIVMHVANETIAIQDGLSSARAVFESGELNHILIH